MESKPFTRLIIPIVFGIFLTLISLFFIDISHQNILAAEAQNALLNALDPEQVVWANYTNMSFVNDVAVEGDILWVATDGGVLAWDLTTQVYTRYTTLEGLLSNGVTSVEIDDAQRKWFGTGRGINILDDTHWSSYTTANSDLPSNSIRDITIADNGDLWFATGNGASRFDGANWTNYYKGDYQLNTNSLLAVATHSSDVWIGSWGEGVAKFDGANWTPYILTDDAIQGIVNDIAIGNDGIVWVGSGNTLGSAGGGLGMLARFDGADWITYTVLNSGLQSSHIFGLGVDTNNHVWVGAEFGVDVFDGVNWSHYGAGDGLAAEWVEAVYINGSNYWFGTQGGGVSKLANQAWTTYNETNVLVHNSIRSIASAGNEVWIGAGDPYELDGGLSHFDGYEWETLTSENSPLPVNEVNAIAKDSLGNWWFGTWGGATRYDGENWTTFTTDNGLSAQDNTRVIAVNGNEIWFATVDPFCKDNPWGVPPCGGLSKYDGTNWVAYPISETIGTEIIQDIAFKDNEVWFGTDEGAAKFDGNNWFTYTITDGLASQDVNAVVVDPSGDLWFATSAGVTNFDGLNWTTYTSSNGLSGNSVSEIAVDSNGDIWAGVYNGLNHFDGFSWTVYTSADGLTDSGVFHIAINEDNIWWFGTNYGVSAWFPTASLTLIPSQNNSLASPNQSVTVTIPANTFDSSTTFTYTQQLGPSQSTGFLGFAGASFQIEAVNQYGQPLTSFNNPITLTVDYQLEDVVGLDETGLLLYLWDPELQDWIDAAQTCEPGSTYQRDFLNTKLSVGICHLTEFALMSGPPQPIFIPIVYR